jgi:hypothetical protein
METSCPLYGHTRERILRAANTLLRVSASYFFGFRMSIRFHPKRRASTDQAPALRANMSETLLDR